MKQRREGLTRGRADIQAIVLICAAVSGTVLAVFLACRMLPYRAAVPAAAIIGCVFCLLGAVGARICFGRISNPTRRDMVSADHLTGLRSRNAFETDLNNLQSASGWRRAGVVLVDLDNLKKVNDLLGHTAGDEYLRCAAQALHTCAQLRGWPAYRVGGDEFAVLAPETDEAELEGLIDCVRTRFSAQTEEWSLPLSLSMGRAACDEDRDCSLHDTYRRADRRMYECKRNHRGE